MKTAKRKPPRRDAALSRRAILDAALVEFAEASLEDARPRRHLRERAEAPHEPSPLEHRHLARLDLAHELRPQEIQRARLARHDVRVAEAPQDQRPHPVRVARRHQQIVA